MAKIYSHTTGLCSICTQKVAARIIERDGAIYLEKMCPEHGATKALVSSDVAWYEESQHYIKPGQQPLMRNITEFTDCPDSCGYCPEHQQHVCLPVIEILSHCDMQCPICMKRFAAPFALTAEEFTGIIDNLIRTEGCVDVINISGGEPTLHPQFKELIEIALEKGITQISVSTNGLTLLKDAELRRFFKEKGVVAALQFDGFQSSTYIFLRGADLSAKKLELIELFEKEELPYSLVAAAAKGVNDDEIEAISDFFFRSKALTLMFQPLVFTGNAAAIDEQRHRLTVADIVHHIEQSAFADKGDFNPLPCSHFSCFALSYYFTLEDGEVYSLKKFLGKEDFLNIIANKTLPGLDSEGYDLIKNRIYDLWSAADYSASNEKVLERVKDILRLISTQGLSRKEKLNLGIANMKAVFIHNFMDVHTMDFARLQKCCNPYPQTGDRLVPMCAQNVFFQK
ncbi:MAG: radical SAM protein [Candidatus Electrothrix communis]|nr:MAG: radical SAM protein [Candidatus Electrothrix communis]